MTSVQKWKPGDVFADEGGGRYTVLPHDGGKRRAIDADGFDWYIESIPGIRPLAVIDPENREEVERLDRLQDEGYRALGHEVVQKDCDVEVLQAALREFAAPTPKIEEPTGRYAAVRDRSGEEWVRDGLDRFGMDYGAWWSPQRAKDRTERPWRRDWDDLDIAEVLTEGVPA